MTGSVKLPEKDRMLMSVVNDSFFPKVEEESDFDKFKDKKKN